MKVGFFDRYIWKTFGCIASGISVVLSYITIFFASFIVEHKKCFIILLTVIFLLIYFSILLYANTKKKVTLKIRNTKIIIKEGDIFKEGDSCRKVIPFNEYFDTLVDDKIIAKGSLNGKYLLNVVTENKIEKLNDDIKNGLDNSVIDCIDQQRKPGKTIKYKLGTIYVNDEYFLLAYSRFNESNKAYLTNEDVAKCYMNMWNEIDKHRAYYSVSMPVLGSSGMVRFDKDYKPQQLIEMILWTFRISGINLNRTTALNIIVHKSMISEINFIKLKDYGD